MASVERARRCCRAGCENEGALRCKACLGARYCGRACQVSDWRAGHRTACGTCARCGTRPTSAHSTCAGKSAGAHAEFDLAWTGSTFGPEGATSTYACGRCGETIKRVVEKGVERLVDGPARCKLVSSHCMHEALLTDEDAYAACKEYVVSIPSREDRESFGLDAQKALDDAPDDAETIVIRAIGGYCRDAELTFPKKKYPALKNLRIFDVDMKSLTLTEEFCPRLAVIQTQNSLDECAKSGKLKITPPSLREVSIHHFEGSQSIIQEMLDSAPYLECFDSYKLWVKSPEGETETPCLNFQSPFLTRLNLHRADSLTQLTLATPLLRALVLRACHDLQDLKFVPLSERTFDKMDASKEQRYLWRGPYGPDLEEAARSLGRYLPPDFQNLTSRALTSRALPLRVILLNSIIGERALLELRRHPRVDPQDLLDEVDDPDTPSWMKPHDMESQMKDLQLEIKRIEKENPTKPYHEVLAEATLATNRKHVRPEFFKMFHPEEDDNLDEGESEAESEGSCSGETIVLDGSDVE